MRLERAVARCMTDAASQTDNQKPASVLRHVIPQQSPLVSAARGTSHINMVDAVRPKGMSTADPNKNAAGPDATAALKTARRFA